MHVGAEKIFFSELVLLFDTVFGLKIQTIIHYNLKRNI